MVRRLERALDGTVQSRFMALPTRIFRLEKRFAKLYSRVPPAAVPVELSKARGEQADSLTQAVERATALFAAFREEGLFEDEACPNGVLRVEPDWRSIRCAASASGATSGHDGGGSGDVAAAARGQPDGINALSNSRVAHHRVLSRFRPATVALKLDPQSEHTSTYVYDALGTRFPMAVCDPSSNEQDAGVMELLQRAPQTAAESAGGGLRPRPVPRISHAGLQRACDLFQTPEVTHSRGARLQLTWPVLDADYFEVVDVLRAVDDFVAEVRSDVRAARPVRTFASVEIGASHTAARSTFLAQQAVSQRLSSAARRRLLVLDQSVDVISAAYDVTKLNGIASHAIAFHHGVVKAGFYKIDANLIGLTRLLRLHRLPCTIDWLRVDLLGAQRDFFEGGTVLPALTAHVRRVYITYPTFGSQRILQSVLSLFGAHGWLLTAAFPEARGPLPSVNLSHELHDRARRPMRASLTSSEWSSRFPPRWLHAPQWGGAIDFSARVVALTNPSTAPAAGGGADACPWKNRHGERQPAPPQVVEAVKQQKP